MDGRKVTLSELKNGIEKAINRGISEGAVVLWSDIAYENSDYCIEYGAAPGSLLLGLEYFDDGDVVRGTLQIQPSKLSDQLS